MRAKTPPEVWIPNWRATVKEDAFVYHIKFERRFEWRHFAPLLIIHHPVVLVDEKTLFIYPICTFNLETEEFEEFVGVSALVGEGRGDEILSENGVGALI